MRYIRCLTHARFSVSGAALVIAFASSAVACGQQYASADPTPDEQYVLEVINRARANPTAEGARLQPLGLPNGDITEGLVAPDNQVGIRPPLAMNKILLSRYA